MDDDGNRQESHGYYPCDGKLRPVIHFDVLPWAEEQCRSSESTMPQYQLPLQSSSEYLPPSHAENVCLSDGLQAAVPHKDVTAVMH